MTELEKTYLPEDRDLVEKLESILGSNAACQIDVSKIQVKSTLRTRKTMVDLDASNKRFSYVLGFFAIVQIIIAAFQFLLQVVDFSNKAFSIFIAIAFLGIILWLDQKMDKFMSTDG
jgi:hypothetical protein